MGARKRAVADERKELRKSWYGAILKNYPTSPRKMRLIADLIRGKDANTGLSILQYLKKSSAKPLEKLLRSAIANWGAKNEGKRIEDAELYVKDIFVDGARGLKRILPAPQGRAYRFVKRSNHITLVLGSRKEESEQVFAGEAQEAVQPPSEQESAPSVQ